MNTYYYINKYIFIFQMSNVTSVLTVYWQVVASCWHWQLLTSLWRFWLGSLFSSDIWLRWKVDRRISVRQCLLNKVFSFRIFAGYFSARLYKTLNGQKWKRAALVTGTLYPGVIASLAFILNFFIWGKQSSGAVRECVIFNLPGMDIDSE